MGVAFVAVHRPAYADTGMRPGTLITFQATTAGLESWNMRHQNGRVRMDVITDASDQPTRMDATFWVRPGLANSKCPVGPFRDTELDAVSFEPVSSPGSFMRHRDFAVYTEARDGSAQFDQDATFCVHPGLTGHDLSFDSYNVPAWWLRHWWAELYIAQPWGQVHPWDQVEKFWEDATFKVLNPRYTPDAGMPLASYTPTRAIQLTPAQPGQLGTVEYAYVDNVGRLMHGRQSDPDNYGNVQWTAINAGEAFTGTPTVGTLADGRVQVSGQNINGSVWTKNQTEPGSPAWSGWNQLGGFLASSPVAGRMPDGSTAFFAVSTEGELWVNAQTGMLPRWKSLGDFDLVGTPSVVGSRNGLQVFAVGPGGSVTTAEYTGGVALSAWTSLGGSGLNGAVAPVVYPGFRMRVFVRAADGTVVTKAQGTGGVWSTAWQSTGTVAAAGAPTAILDPVEGRTCVVVRGTDNQIWRSWETAQGSGQGARGRGPWRPPTRPRPTRRPRQ
jgi:hypothetical protein